MWTCLVCVLMTARIKREQLAGCLAPLETSLAVFTQRGRLLWRVSFALLNNDLVFY